MFPLSGTTVAPTTCLFDSIHLKQRRAQNFLLIWLDADIDQTKEDCQNMLTQLRTIVNDVNIFTQLDECIQFLSTIDGGKAFVIASGSLGQCLVPGIHAMPQLDEIYIFDSNKSRYQQWAKEWSKIKGVHAEMVPICESLQQTVKQYKRDSIAMSFVTMDEETSNKNLDQLDPSFMYTQIFKDIFLEMEYQKQSIKDFTLLWRDENINYPSKLSVIAQFERDYYPKSSILWYIRESFIYEMLNRALRTLEADIIIKMGFLIHDLHYQLEQLHQQQIDGCQGQSFIVYRGQGLSTTDFEKLLKTKGGLISFNNFLSTSKNETTSLFYAESASTKPNTLGIQFIMLIDPSVTSSPFAVLHEADQFGTEEEILFSMHTIFRVGEISKMDNSNTLYQVELKLTSDNDEQLRTITDRIREEVAGRTGWDRLCTLLVKIGQFDKAEELCKLLLDQTFDEIEKACYYHHLGYVTYAQGDYEKAMWYYTKGLEIDEKILPSNHPELATYYNNIGLVYDDKGEYSKALSLYEKALKIREKILPPGHRSLATSYNNIASIHDCMEDFSKALSFYEKARAVLEKALPINHPDLATVYNNIGAMYDNMREHSKALSLYEKALEIRRKTLPPHHPDLANCYNNIGLVYYNMSDYSKALPFLEKDIEFRQKSLSCKSSFIGCFLQQYRDDIPGDGRVLKSTFVSRKSSCNSRKITVPKSSRFGYFL